MRGQAIGEVLHEFLATIHLDLHRPASPRSPCHGEEEKYCRRFSNTSTLTHSEHDLKARAIAHDVEEEVGCPDTIVGCEHIHPKQTIEVVGAGHPGWPWV